MLVTSNYKKGDAITLKLSTGEEIVARFETSGADDIEIVKPTVLTLNPQDGKVILIPWLMSVDVHSSTPVKIGRSQVVAIGIPVKHIADNYIQSTTGIAPANALQL